MLDRARSTTAWDVVVIGGGATGLGTAVDAASRGLTTLLLERGDFAKGTSSRSTKLAHGGVRYLRQGQIGLVMKALKERGRMLANAPHLVSMRRFVVPCRTLAETAFYGAGLKLYDLLSLGRGAERSRILARGEVLAEQSGIRSSVVSGGVAYYDGQFDDARFALGLAQTCVREGGTVLNYCQVVSLTKASGRVSGVIARDLETGEEFEIQARCVINATGVFVDAVRRMDRPGVAKLVQASQGIHVVLPRSFLPGESALMVPKTDDGRVLFAIPWQGHLLLGTTDTRTEAILEEPAPLQDEVAYLLEHAARYLSRAPSAADVSSIFVGLRPLVGGSGGPTKSVPREHSIEVSESGLMTITGGKWTTYRLMAQQAVDKALRLLGVGKRKCVTAELRLHAWSPAPSTEVAAGFSEYGSERSALLETVAGEEEGNRPLHAQLPYVMGQIAWATRNEMARTVEDVLARRTRSLFLDARASIEAAPAVAAVLGRELGRDADWQASQVSAFSALAKHYQIPSSTLG